MSKLTWKLSHVLIVMSVAISGASLFGCASQTPPPPERSTSEIKRDADRAFEKMKQEEREYKGEGSSPAR